ncbi:UNVERIFIED_CONTAM: hypothetical protein K2H54_029557 [Gekko kuhli]
MQSFVLIAVLRDSPQSLFCQEVVGKQNLISIYIFRAVGMLYCTCEGMPCLRNQFAAQAPTVENSKLGQGSTKIGKWLVELHADVSKTTGTGIWQCWLQARVRPLECSRINPQWLWF